MLPFLGLTATADPAAVAPGDPVTLIWRVENPDQEAVAGAVLAATIPKELVVTPAAVAPPLRYDPAARRLTWTLPRLEPGAVLAGQVAARLAGLRTGAAIAVLAELRLADGALVTQAAVTVQAAPPAPQATQLGPAGGVVTLADEGVTLTFPPGALAEAAQVSAQPLGRPAGAPGNVQRAFEFVVRARGGEELHTFGQPLTLTVAHPEGEPTGGRLFLRDDATGQWQMLPTTWDAQAGALVAAVPHLSTTGEGNNFVPEVMPSIRGVQTDLFTGAASYDYPLAAPPGAGGLAPQMALQFNSKLRWDDPGGHNSVAGAGWKLTADSFRYYAPYQSGTPAPTWRVGGAAFSEGGSGNTIYLKEAPEWRVVQINGSANGPADAYASDGTRYHFEPALSDWYCQGTSWARRTDKWALQYVTDTVGNRIDYTYDTALPVDPVDVNTNYASYGDRVREVHIVGTCAPAPYGETIHYLSQINLTRISYNGGQATIDFTYAITRSDAPIDYRTDVNQSWAFYTTRLLTAIKIKQAGNLVAAYKLEYDFFANADDPQNPVKQLYALRAIRRCSDDALTSCLPATSFTNSSSQMLELNNGYGGILRLGYGADSIVTSRTVTDTVTGQAQAWSYSYADKLITGTVGYQTVTETLPSSLGPGNTVYHHFLSGTDPDVGLRGKEDQQVVKISGGITQTQLLRTWAYTTTGVYGGANFVYLSQEKQYTYDKDGANPQGRATQYFYDTDHQGGAQYGNLTRSKEYSDATMASLYRTTERWYYPRVDTSNGKYIVNRAAEEKLLNSTGGCRVQTRWIYDTTGFNQHAISPTLGLLKEVWQAKTCDSSSQADWIRPALYGYDSYGNRTSVTWPNGTVMSTTYDATFHAYPLAVAVDPPGAGEPTLTTAYAYYGINQETGGSGLKGQLQKITDPNSAVSRYSYDAFGRATELRKPGADSFSYAATEKYTYTDAAPFTIKHSLKDDTLADTVTPTAATYLEDWTFYDGLGQVIQTQAEAGQSSNSIVVASRYNALGLVVSQTVPYVLAAPPGTYVTAPNWNDKTQYAYDALGRTRVVTQTNGITVSTFYNGFKTATLDELGHQTIQEVDSFGRLLSSKQYSNTYSSPSWAATAYATATYGYNIRDQLNSLLDADNASTSVTYDNLGRKTQMSDPDMGTWTYDYDAAGNLTRQTDARNQTLCFYYDGQNRLTGKHYRADTNCPTSNPTLAVSYGYDSTTGGNPGLGRRTAMTDTTGNTAWVYDSRGRMTQETKTISNPQGGTYISRWSYDSADRVSTLTYPDSEVVTYTYNARGLLRTAIGASVYVSDTFYNALGQVTGRYLGATGVVRQAYTYSAAVNFRLATLQSSVYPTSTLLQNISYIYDAAGNVRVITDTAAAGGSQTQLFSYDDLSRLKTAMATGGSGTYAQVFYAYSPGGNVSYFEGKNFGYNDTGHKHAVTHVDSAQKYWYDANGNATRRDTLYLAYDAENRLTNVTGGMSETHAYDGNGVRVKTLDATNGITTTYVAANYEIRNGAVKKYYEAGGVRVAISDTGALYWLLSDHLGSTNLTVRGNDGVLDKELRYKPYGETRYITTGQRTTYRFTGQRWDPGTGLYFYNARWYDPVIGRFIQPDTIVPNPSDPQSLNRYTYVLNNPLRYQDPTGHVISSPAPRQCPDGQCDARRYMEQRPIGVISNYYTPKYDPQPDASGNPGDDPNNWTGSVRSNAGTQGSVVVGSQVWHYDHNSHTFSSSANPCQGNGVSIVLGCTQAVVAPKQPPDGKTVYVGTAAVAAPCPHNIRCAKNNPDGSPNPQYDPDYRPVYVQSARRTIIIETDKSILLLTPLDSGFELAPDQVDLYVGIAPLPPGYPAELNLKNPRAWQLE